MRIGRVAVIIATLMFAASRADATPPVLVNDTSHPSVVTVTDAFFTHITGIDIVCVGFVQNGQKTAKQVGLSLAYVDAQGVVIGVELNYMYGKFGSGLPAGTSTPRYPVDHPFTNGNCHKTIHDGGAVTSSFIYRPRGAAQAVAVAGIVASAREVIYEDGTAFRTDDVPKTGDKLPFAIPSPAAAVASGGPLYSASTSVTEPFKVLDIIPNGIRGEVCFRLQNGAKNATLARVALVKIGRGGKVLEADESQTSGRYTAAAVMGNDICTRVKGRDVGVELFADTDGGRAAIGRVIAVPLHEEFADGSAWDNPHPPRAGDPGQPLL